MELSRRHLRLGRRVAELCRQACSRIAGATWANDLLIDFTRGWTVVTVQVDRFIGVAKGRNRLPGLAAVLGAIARHEVDAIVVPSLHHLGSSVDSLLETLAKLHRRGVKLVVRDHADAGETGGMMAVADLLVAARRAYRRERIVGGQLRARAAGVRFGRPPVPSGRLEGASGPSAKDLRIASVCNAQ